MDPFWRFLIALLVCSAVAFTVLGGVADRLLTQQMLNREAQVSAEAVRLLAGAHLDPARFRSALARGDLGPIVRLGRYFTTIPEILDVKIYDSHGTVVWGSDAREVGTNHVGEKAVARAIAGELQVDAGVFKLKDRFITGHYDGGRPLKVYVPVSAANSRPYAVIEIDKAPVTFARDLAQARRMLWASSLGVGILLFVALARVFLRARKTEMKLNVRTREAESQLIHGEKLRLMGEMAAVIAHEINNPLGILMGKAHELRVAIAEGSVQQVSRDDFDIFIQEIGRIRDVSRSLLLLARKSDFVFEPTDVNEVLRDTERFVSQSFARASVNIVNELDSALPKVKADANQLKQVFLNLLQNAKDAMPQGGTIKLRTGSTGGKVYVEVADSGGGIPPENMARIFDPFFSTKLHRQGAGLGLSVSHRIVDGHEGNIEVHSELGHGSVFRVVFPALA